MSHRFDQVLAAFVNTLTAAPLVGGGGVAVFRFRTRSLGEEAVWPGGESDFPAVAVYMGEDSPLGDLAYEGQVFIRTDLQVFTDIWARQTADDIDVTLLKLRRRVTNALLQDDKMGLAFVDLVIPAGGDEPVVEHLTAEVIASYRLRWIIRLRLAAPDEGDGAFDPLP